MSTLKTIHLQYFALLREQRGCEAETIQTRSATPADLYAELREVHGLTLPAELLKVAVNGAYRDRQSLLADGDRVVFIQPVAGG